MVKYNIYPTLLDTFYWYKIKGDIDELLNKINRVKTPLPEAAAKGIAFEVAVIDAISHTNIIEHTFDQKLVDRIAAKLRNHTKTQEYIEGVVNTRMGDVKLYGFVDFSYPERYVDLKTTGKYKKGKFENNNQHGCYSLISVVKKKPIKFFDYLVTDFHDMYVESYVPCDAIHDHAIFNIVEFCEWLEANRSKITDKKIFNLK